MDNALKLPFLQICNNAGKPSKEIVDAKTNMSMFDTVIQEPPSVGYNAKTGYIEDLILAGIIEPTKSNRCALQNAASVVNQILSSQFMIVDTL
jgi:chaperonin GroEL